MGPVLFNHADAFGFIQWFAYHVDVLGLDHVYVYLVQPRNIPVAAARVLRHYHARGKATLIDWSPVGDTWGRTSWHHMQVSTECTRVGGTGRAQGKIQRGRGIERKGNTHVRDLIAHLHALVTPPPPTAPALSFAKNGHDPLVCMSRISISVSSHICLFRKTCSGVAASNYSCRSLQDTHLILIAIRNVLYLKVVEMHTLVSGWIRVIIIVILLYVLGCHRLSLCTCHAFQIPGVPLTSDGILLVTNVFTFPPSPDCNEWMINP
jgi:hypothetical protein